MRTLRPDHFNQHQVEMSMRVQAYFGVYGNKAAIELIERVSRQTQFEVKELGLKRLVEHKSNEPSRWLWRTQRSNLDQDNIEAEVERLIGEVASFSAEWRQAIGQAEERCLTLIVQLNESESPNGLVFSRDTIDKLSSLEAALDVDYVSTMV